MENDDSLSDEKCPNCGTILRPQTEICPVCNMRLNFEEEMSKELGNSSNKGEKYCITCEKPLLPETKFCPECGTEQSKSAQPSTSKNEKFCITCETPLLLHTEFCPECGTEQPKRAHYLTAVQMKAQRERYPYMFKNRPTGVTILTILIGLGLPLNIMNITTSFGMSPIIGLIEVTLIILQITSVFGLWNMKRWGANVAMGLYSFNIIYNAILSFVLSDLLADWAWQEYGTSLPSQYKSAFVATFKTTLMSQFFFALILSMIIIGYIYSKREFFRH